MAHSKPLLRWVMLLTLVSAGAGAYIIGFRGPDLVAASSPEASTADLAAVSVEAPSLHQAFPAEFDLVGEQDSHRQERREVGNRFIERELQDSERQRLARRAVELNERLLVRLPSVKDIEKYIVRPGDSLTGIARKFKRLKGATGSLLMLNGLKESDVLRPGQSLRISKGMWSILVDKSLFSLYLCYEDAPFRTYPVAIGANGKTPTGEFTIDGKNSKPMWWPPRNLGIRSPVMYGDPQNPLGDWWIGLEHRFHSGFGIHGTNDPGSIGTQASLGCVRMKNEEVAEIAAIAFRGMVVQIVD
jgi:hypothetical protein